MRLVLAALLLAPAVAFGQLGISLTLEGVSDPSAPLVKAGSSCEDTVRVTWAIPAIGASACDELQIWATTAACGDRAGTGDTTIAEYTQAELFSVNQATESVLVRELPNFTAERVCPAADKEDTVRICATVKTQNALGQCDQFVRELSEPEIIYDPVPPAVPTIAEITPLDGALSVQVELPEDAPSFVLEYSTSGSGFTQRGPFSSNPARLDGLENNTEYIVRAKAVDEAGNVSTESAELRGTPVLTEGFFGRYREAGGLENGGCSTAGGGLSLLGAAMALAAGALRRRRG